MVRSAECGGSPLANALSVKDVVELPEEVPQGVNPRVASLTHPKRCGGTSLGFSQAGPAYTTNSATGRPGEGRCTAESGSDWERCAAL